MMSRNGYDRDVNGSLLKRLKNGIEKKEANIAQSLTIKELSEVNE
jgi:hypothetical protein